MVGHLNRLFCNGAHIFGNNFRRLANIDKTTCDFCHARGAENILDFCHCHNQGYDFTLQMS